MIENAATVFGVHKPRILKFTYQEVESLVYMKCIILRLLTI